MCCALLGCSVLNNSDLSKRKLLEITSTDQIRHMYSFIISCHKISLKKKTKQQSLYCQNNHFSFFFTFFMHIFFYTYMTRVFYIYIYSVKSYYHLAIVFSSIDKIHHLFQIFMLPFFPPSTDKLVSIWIRIYFFPLWTANTLCVY